MVRFSVAADQRAYEYPPTGVNITRTFMLSVLKKLFGDKNQREIDKLVPRVSEINDAFSRLADVSDEELRGKTEAFRQEIREGLADLEQEKTAISAALGDVHAQGGTASQREDSYRRLEAIEEEILSTLEGILDRLLPEAFATVKEVCRRFSERGELRFEATDLDRAAAKRFAHPRIQGDEAVYTSSWSAAGAEIRWNMVPYDVQLIGGMALHYGNIAEMKTGEGKTLVAVAPVYLNALAGRGVHLVTVNPYLAERDMEWMGPIFRALGLSTEVIDRYDPHSDDRRRAYRSDITYGTNAEFGFDYLRDNSFVVEAEQLVQRGHHYAIVDEVDSVLIDEARTPLIISGPVPKANDGAFMEFKPAVERLWSAQQKLVAEIVRQGEQLLAERDKLKEQGDEKEARLREEEAGLSLLRAYRGYQKNKRLIKIQGESGVEQLRQKTEYFYLQDNGKRMPEVDEELYFALDPKQRSIELTEKGREHLARSLNMDQSIFVLPDIGEEVARYEREVDHEEPLEERKRALYALYSERAERLHAIEQLLKAYSLFEKDVDYIVQEGRVQIVDEHTGRVLSGRRYSEGLHQAIEAKENVKVQAATQTYATVTLQNYFRLYDKLAGMTGTAETEAEEFFKIYQMDVLVIPTNRPIARKDLDDLVFKSRREKYNAMIDKVRAYHEKGQPVLVGTTSVEVSEALSRLLKRDGIPHNVLNAKRDRAAQEADIVAEAGRKGAVTIATNMAGRGTDIKLAEGVRELGGLAIIGSERHDSRRIDLQLRGRSGRQGDPGESQFYISLEDNLMRFFGPDRIAGVMDRLKLEDGAVITHPMVNKSIERAQKKVEQNNFGIRKRQLEYDDVLNAQREVIYDKRRNALLGERLRGEVDQMLRGRVQQLVEEHTERANLEDLREDLIRVLALPWEIQEGMSFDREADLVDDIVRVANKRYDERCEALARPFYESMRGLSQRSGHPDRVYVDFTDGQKALRAVVSVADALTSEGHAVNRALERVALLQLIDAHWTEHLRNLDEVKEGVGLRAYGQRDPLIEYKMEAFGLFKTMMETIDRETVSFIFRSGPLSEGDRTRAAAGRAPARMDASRAKAQHDTSSNYQVTAGASATAQSARGASSDPTATSKPVVVEDRVGRNDPCPCGSGKKYKLCHGRK